MVAHLWFFYALFASILWGVAYALSDKLLRSGMSPAFMMLATQIITLPIFLFIIIKFDNLQEQLTLLKESPLTLTLCILMAVTVVGGNLFILFSMADKNATLTSIIESSYPIFVFIFSWIFFKEVQVNWQQAIGGMLILAGVVLIYFKS